MNTLKQFHVMLHSEAQPAESGSIYVELATGDGSFARVLLLGLRGVVLCTVLFYWAINLNHHENKNLYLR